MGSFYTTEERIERIERYLGINDTTRIEQGEYIEIRSEADQMDDHLLNLKKYAKRIISDIERATKSLEKYQKLLDLIEKE